MTRVKGDRPFLGAILLQNELVLCNSDHLKYETDEKDIACNKHDIHGQQKH